MLRNFLFAIIASVPFICFSQIHSDATIFEKNQMKYFKMQYAGNLGFLSMGAGMTFFNSRLTMDFNYGYLPKRGHGERVHTVALKSSVYFLKLSTFKVRTGYYIGTSFTYSITNNTYAKYPKYYPKGYYDISNAFHLNPYVGLAIPVYSNSYSLKTILFFTELGTVDYLIWNDIRNKDINAKEIWNLCFGVKVAL